MPYSPSTGSWYRILSLTPVPTGSACMSICGGQSDFPQQTWITGHGAFTCPRNSTGLLSPPPFPLLFLPKCHIENAWKYLPQVERSYAKTPLLLNVIKPLEPGLTRNRFIRSLAVSATYWTVPVVRYDCIDLDLTSVPFLDTKPLLLTLL